MGWKDSESLRIAVLDPAGEPKGSVHPTVYIADELLVARRAHDVATDENGQSRFETPYQHAKALAAAAGWALDEIGEGTDAPVAGGIERQSEEPPPPTRLRISVRWNPPKDAEDDPKHTHTVASTPDAWQILRQAKADGLADGLSLNHVLAVDPFKANPFTANPFKANPFTANPFKANAAGVGIDSYAAPGFGGRQPVTYVGPAPERTAGKDEGPLVAILDTGIGRHGWFQSPGVLVEPVDGAGPIGAYPPAEDPDKNPTGGDPLDGLLDDVAGHGTFIAGLVRQKCPNARILPIGVANGEGLILENQLLGTLERLLAFPGGVPAVLVLSFGFYHEDAEDDDTISRLKDLLQQFRGKGSVVVCSAGNEATDRPAFPAAFAPGEATHVSVGARNPSGTTIALFSNIGDWVDVFVAGVSLVSTIPVDFQGSVQAGMRDDGALTGVPWPRETLDIDDFRGGFGVWSGTSFAAPVFAGAVAAALDDGMGPEDAVAAAKDAVGV